MSNHFQTPQKKSFESDEFNFASQINTPPASVTKKLFNSFKNKRQSTNSFFSKTSKKSTEDLNDKISKKKIPTPLNLLQPDNASKFHASDSLSMKFGFDIPDSNENVEKLQKTKISAYCKDDVKSTNSSFGLMNAADPFGNNSSIHVISKNNGRKKYTEEICYICQESLKVLLKGEKPVEVEDEGIAHNECYLMKDELQNSTLLSANGTNNLSLTTAPNNHRDSFSNLNGLLNQQPQSYLKSSQNSSSLIENNHIECIEQNDLLTPVNQIVPSNQISENGFRRENIKTTHQKVKNYSTIDQNLDFDVSILPQFHKVDIFFKDEDPLTVPHVLKLNNKKNYSILKNISNISEKTEKLEGSLIKCMSDEFIRLFPNVFKDFDINTISLNIVDFVEISFSDEVYVKFIIILDSAMDKVFLMSLNGLFSTVLKFDKFYKVIRLEESILVYSTSLESPEISIRQPRSENEFSDIMDMGFSLDKWYQVLKWRIGHKAIKTHISSFATNLFEAIEFEDCCSNLHNYIDYVIQNLPSDVMAKIISIANQEYLDVGFIMPALIESKNNQNSQSSAKLLDYYNGEPNYLCIAINTFEDISLLVKELVNKSSVTTKLALIRPQPDGSFSYIGFFDKSWDDFDEIDICEKSKNDYLNLDNMFMKLYSLFTINGLEYDEFIELKIFNDQPIENLGKSFTKIMQKFTNISIYNYEISNQLINKKISSKLENYMEQTYQFVNNYSTVTFSTKQLNSEVFKDLIFNQTAANTKFVKLEIIINPFFESCIKFKNFENMSGHNVFIENSDSIKSINLKLRNELDCKLLLLDLEITNNELFLKLLDSIDKKDLKIFDNKVSLIFFKINNIDEYYSSNSVFFNVSKKQESKMVYHSTTETSSSAVQKLIFDNVDDTDKDDEESDDSSTIDLFITTPITTNKEPLYLLREIELQLITIINNIFFNPDKKMEKAERMDIINYYYTIFFSYSKNIDIKNSYVNFGYESISKYIDNVFKILLSNDQFNIQMLYEMMRYQYRGYIRGLGSV
ncbi:hypothetical protein FOG51_02534 [Hanseniaspora uvarum]|nr:hypothetical protein FOG51_02534 [Hanseniaspora uvarum]